MIDKIFFQSSLPRSGSTLFQNILAQNQDIYPTPTSPMVDYLGVLREVFTNNPNVLAQNEIEMTAAFKGMCNSAIKGYFESLTDRKYIFDKSRIWTANYDFIKFILDEESKIICLVRDLRDIFSSNEKNFRKNPHKSRVNFGLGDANTLPKRVDVWSSSGNFTGSAIEFLHDSIITGVCGKILFIKYETLCLYPETVMKRVYNYLNIPEFEHNFEMVEQFTQEDDKMHGIFGQHKIKNKVELVTSDAQYILGKPVCDWIYNNYGWFYEYFGYTY